jgi:uncharacterized repeat protein (TIGR03803 family)
MLAASPAHAQTYSVIHSFSGGGDGATPAAGLTLNGGILYGTAAGGGGVIGRRCDPRNAGCGVVYQMKQHGTAWVLSPLYAFTGFNDGLQPEAPVVFGPGGLLYGSTRFGGNIGVQQCDFGGCGVVFTLHPPPTSCHAALCEWIENPIYQFPAIADGSDPFGPLTFDSAGNMYGTTAYGGTCNNNDGCGTVFQLTRSGSGWTKTILHNFGQGTDGVWPFSGVIIDSLGNLYGTTINGGVNSRGTVFELTPSGSGWNYSVIYNFQDGAGGFQPYGGLIMDAAGNLYGATSDGGTGGGGTVYELSPSGGGWTFSVIASLSGQGASGPYGSLTFDSAGNLYGTTQNDGAFRFGNVFKLTPSGGQWTYTDLYDFTGGSDGASPFAGVTLDSNGNIYGTAQYAGLSCSQSNRGCGVVWEITP